MLHFFHTADIHLGASNQIQQYRDDALPLLIKDAKDNNVNIILMIGDIFDKDQPNQRIKDYLLAQIVSNSDIQFFITIGNHDYATKAKDYHSLNTYSILGSNVANVHVCEVGTHNFPLFELVVLPDIWGEQPAGTLPIKSTKPIICAWHGDLTGNNVTSEITDVLIKTGADYLALGDRHKHVQLHERCWYPGALTQKTYACEDGYVLVEINGKEISTQSRHLALPKRFNLAVRFDANDTADSVIEAVRTQIPAGNLVRLKFNVSISTWAAMNKRKIFNELSKDFLEVKLHNDPVLVEMQRDGASVLAGATTINEEITVMLEHEETPLDKNILAKMLHAYVERC